MKIKFVLKVMIVLLLVTAFSISSVMAVGPRFVKSSASVDRIGSLIVSFKESGLSSNQWMRYTITGTVNVAYGCKNGKTVTALDTNSDSISADWPIYADKNGNVVSGMNMPPPSSAGICNTGNKVVACVDYFNVVLRDEINYIEASFPSPVSKDLYPAACP
jgi:hypothetical protein